MTFPTQALVNVRDGHPQLVGAELRATRCDHSHIFFDEGEPEAGHNWPTFGLPLKTLFAQIDNLAAPTEVLGLWLKVAEDDTDPFDATWLPLPSGGTFSGDAGDIPVTPTGTLAATDVQAALVEILGDIETHVADASGAHAASAISVLDSGGNFTATEVEAVLAEIATALTAAATAAGTSVADSGGFYTGTDAEAVLAELPSLFIEKRHGGREVINVVADAGASETLDMGDGNFHDVTLTEACTITMDGATNGVLCYATILLRGNFAVTWADTITWLGGSAPSAAALVSVTLFTTDGGTSYIGAHSQGAGGTPDAHAASHENGGSDEISVAGLSGLLADGQTPLTHATSHEPGGGDAMDVDAAANVGSLRTLGTGATQAALGTHTHVGAAAGYDSVLTNGDLDNPELIFASGDVVMVFIPA